MEDIYYAIIGISLSVLYIFYVIIERLLINYYRKKIPLIIHINGIRGKSTTTRLIDAGLRNCGLKVFSKTTGTIPTMINTNNEDVVIKRLGKANIREQIKMLRKAAKENADVLVLECMAVNPELQKICEEKILKANITIITNVRMDHIKDIVNGLLNTIPKQKWDELKGIKGKDIEKTAESADAPRVVVLFAFEDLDILMRYAKQVQVESVPFNQLYKFEGIYFLMMDMTDSQEADVRKLSALTDEYAADIFVGAEKRAFIYEHGEVILKERAIEQLREI